MRENSFAMSLPSSLGISSFVILSLLKCSIGEICAKNKNSETGNGVTILRRRTREVADAPSECHNADRHVQNVKYAGVFHAIFLSSFVSPICFYRALREFQEYRGRDNQ